MTSYESRLNVALKNQYLHQRYNYDKVFVHLIYWAESDDDGFKHEAEELQALFEALNYTVDSFPIPSANSQHFLTTDISKFWERIVNERTLGIIHYGGHADKNEHRTSERRAVWSSHADISLGGKVNWYQIQPNLANFRGDVLLILDCCFAAQAARASSGDRDMPLNVELLAACSMNDKTPLADHHSFTTAFIKTLRSFLDGEDSSVTVSQIFDALSSRKAELNGSPYRQGIGREARTILLRRLPRYPQKFIARKPEAAVQLSVLLDSSVNDAILGELITFLKTDAPQVVCGVECSHIVSFAEAASRYMRGSGTKERFAIGYDELEGRSKSLVGSAWSECRSCIISLMEFLRAVPSRNWVGATVSAATADREALIAGNLQDSINSFKQDLALAVLSTDATSETGRAALRIAIESPTLRELGVSEILKLRLLQSELTNNPPDIETRRVMPSTSTVSEFSPNLVLEKVTDQTAVLVEYKYYEKAFKQTKHGQEVQKKRIATLAAMLRAAVSEDYLALRCRSCFHDDANCRYGLSFELPLRQQTRPYSLREILFRPQKFGRARLKERFGIAKKVGEAVLKWHTSGWLHQGIASHNIIFLLDPDCSRIDYSKPYLCGFEYSRKSDEISAVREMKDFNCDVYRHPVRQGLPIVGHRIEHDLYSLGVVMLDIGLWAPVEDLFPEAVEASPVPLPTDVQARILKNVPRLYFYMGTRYAEAVRRCVEADWERGKSGLKIAEDFKINVLDKIHSGHGL